MALEVVGEHAQAARGALDLVERAAQLRAEQRVRLDQLVGVSLTFPIFANSMLSDRTGVAAANRPRADAAD